MFPHNLHQSVVESAERMYGQGLGAGGGGGGAPTPRHHVLASRRHGDGDREQQPALPRRAEVAEDLTHNNDKFIIETNDG